MIHFGMKQNLLGKKFGKKRNLLKYNEPVSGIQRAGVGSIKKGDILKVNMSSVKGHEQQRYGPVIVVSEESVHKETDLIWVLPITNTDKGFPTHVPINGRTKNNKVSDADNQTTGYILCEKIKAIDSLARSARLTDEANRSLIEECKSIIDAITYIG